MGTPLDGQFGFVAETVWNSASAPSRFLEVLASSEHDWNPSPLQGQGLRVTRRFPRGDRRQAGVGQAEAIKVTAELQSKAFGALLALCCPYSTTNAVSGTTYQELFTPALTTPFMPSATLQFGNPEVNAAGTVDAVTYKGATVKSWQIDYPEFGIPTLSVDFWAATMTTGTALATATYATSPTTFGPSAMGVTLGGNLTVPTTTALGTGGTATTAVRSWTLSVDNGLKTRPGSGGWQQPVAGAPSANLKVKLDYGAATWRDLQVSQGTTSFAAWFTGAALSTGTERFEIDIPQMFVDSGAFPKLSDDEPDVPEITFAITENGVAQAFYLLARTADSAL